MIRDVLERYREIIADNEMKPHEIFLLVGEIGGAVEDYCRGLGTDDVKALGEIKAEVHLLLMELSSYDIAGIPNWIEPVIKGQIIAMVDPMIESIWRSIHNEN